MNALHKMYIVSHPLRISRYGAHTSLSSAERVEIVDTMMQTLGATLSILVSLKQVQEHLRNISFLPIQDLIRRLLLENTEYTEFLVSGIRDLGGYADVAALLSMKDIHESKCFADCLLVIHQDLRLLCASDRMFREYRERALTDKDRASIRYFDHCIRHNTRFLVLIKQHLLESEAW
ncbi:hypothetical protein [Pseudomonas sp. T1.Ur]|uniref:hypothetical protein n=1 Tax=Pseudomonas sp. T1.Ur TaxID=2928704 RepID=UPI00201D2FB6|nr:hypothetical protein [Pseudomonas sp. T1.Ur]MCL6702852.1 hypothetical protein [Pseudomonas sp. T1.Ur]